MKAAAAVLVKVSAEENVLQVVEKIVMLLVLLTA